MKLTSTVILVLLAQLPQIGYCGNGYGKIMEIYAHQNVVNGIDKGVIMFSMEKREGSPAVNATTNCTTTPTDWAFDSSNDHGKAMYAMLLSAAAQGKQVYVRGSGDCKDWSDRERPMFIRISY